MKENGAIYDMKWATKLVKRGTKLEPGMKVRESKRYKEEHKVYRKMQQRMGKSV